MVVEKTGPEPRRYHYDFGPFCLRHDGILLRGSAVITLTPKELAVLRRLLADAGNVTLISELRQAGWGETHVSADSLPRCISSLRARLEPAQCIATVYKRGYRLTVPVLATPDVATLDMTSEAAVTGLAAKSDLASSGLANSSLSPAGDVAARGSMSSSLTGPQGLPRLAILPFQTKNQVPAHLGSEIAEATMLRLGRARTAVVDVLASSTVFDLATRGLAAPEVGELSGAHLVLAGTITSQSLHFRLRAEMFRVQDAVQLWVEDFFVPRELIEIADAHLARLISARILQTFLRPNRLGKMVDPSGSNSASPDFSASPGDSSTPEMNLMGHSLSVRCEVAIARSAPQPESLALEEALV